MDESIRPRTPSDPPLCAVCGQPEVEAEVSKANKWQPPLMCCAFGQPQVDTVSDRAPIRQSWDAIHGAINARRPYTPYFAGFPEPRCNPFCESQQLARALFMESGRG